MFSTWDLCRRFKGSGNVWAVASQTTAELIWETASRHLTANAALETLMFCKTSESGLKEYYVPYILYILLNVWEVHLFEARNTKDHG